MSHGPGAGTPGVTQLHKWSRSAQAVPLGTQAVHLATPWRDNVTIVREHASQHDVKQHRRLSGIKRRMPASVYPQSDPPCTPGRPWPLTMAPPLIQMHICISTTHVKLCVSRMQWSTQHTTKLAHLPTTSQTCIHTAHCRHSRQRLLPSALSMHYTSLRYRVA